MLKFLLILITFLSLNSAQVFGFGNDQELKPKNNLILNPGGEVDVSANLDMQSNSILNGIFDADLNVLLNVEDADIKTGANIQRAKLANGTANYVLINDGSGVMSEEQFLSKSRGGAGADMTSVTFPTSGTLVTEEGPHTITNATLTAPVINGGSLNGQTASVTNQWTPPSDTKANLDALCPSLTAGSLVYATDLGTYYLCDGSTLTEIGSGSGAGGINYIGNPDAEDDLAGWVTFADTGFGEDLTGGSPTSTLTRNTTNELRGLADFLLTKAVSSQYEGFSYQFQLDKADQANIIRVAFDYQADHANYDDGDLRVYIYDVDNSVSIELPVRDIAANARGKYEAYFQTSINSDTYRIGIIVADAVADSYTAQFDNFQVGPFVPVIKNPVIAFQGAKNDAQVFNGTAQIEIDDIVTDTVGGFVPASWEYIAPESGCYFATYNLLLGTTGAVNNQQVWMRIGTTGVYGQSFTDDITAGLAYTHNGSALQCVDKGTSFKLFANSSGGTNSFTLSTGNEGSVFAVHKVGSQNGTTSGARKYFRARLSANQLVTTTTAVADFDSIVTDLTDGNFDTVNNRYVADESGLYSFYSNILYADCDSPFNCRVRLRKNGSSFAEVYVSSLTGSPTSQTNFIQDIVYLNKGDYVDVEVVGDASFTVDGSNPQRTYFGGYKIEGGGSSGAISSGPYVARAQSNVSQVVPTNTTTVVDFNSKKWDSRNSFDLSTDRFTSQESGYYTHCANVLTESVAWAAGVQVALEVYKNSVYNAKLFFDESDSSDNTAGFKGGGNCVDIEMNKRDYTDIRFTHNRGANTTIGQNNQGTWISIKKVK